jgi:hypothetical protein
MRNFVIFRHEIKAVRATCFARGLLSSFGSFGTKIGIFASLVTYVCFNDDVTAEKVSLHVCIVQYQVSIISSCISYQKLWDNLFYFFDLCDILLELYHSVFCLVSSCAKKIQVQRFEQDLCKILVFYSCEWAFCVCGGCMLARMWCYSQRDDHSLNLHYLQSTKCCNSHCVMCDVCAFVAIKVHAHIDVCMCV